MGNQISNILRRGRKAKMHMVLATQDPKLKSMHVDIDNITSRMAFKCAKYQTSINILNRGGAEKLPGKGAMLHISGKYPEPIYIQGAYMPPDEVKGLINRIKAIDYDLSDKFVISEFGTAELSSPSDEIIESMLAKRKKDQELENIILWTLEYDTISASQIKDKFHLGNRVNGIIDILYEMGVVSGKYFKQPRKVLIRSVTNIPQTMIDFMDNNGFSTERICAEIDKSCRDNEHGCLKEEDTLLNEHAKPH